MDIFQCPICKKDHETFIRYKNCICNECLNNYGTKDENGNEKLFSNIDMFGGIMATSNGKEINDYSCFVNKIKCYATEARFGGIVITPTSE
jgi:hypothetical protein